MRSASRVLVFAFCILIIASFGCKKGEVLVAQQEPQEIIAPPPAPVESAQKSDEISAGAQDNTTQEKTIAVKPSAASPPPPEPDCAEAQLRDSCASPVAQNDQYCSGPLKASRIVLCSNGCQGSQCIAGSSQVTLSGYPDFFLLGGLPSVTIVVGDNAPVQHVQAAIELATSLTAKYNEEVKSALSSEISDPDERSLIIIGNPCVNPIAADLLGKPSDCAQFDTDGEGRIRVMRSASGKTYLFVTGKTSDDVRKAARVLAKHESYSFSGASARVQGTLSEPLVVS